MSTLNNLALWGTFLSGLGAFAALVISIYQINKNSKFNEATFWLMLKEHFNQPSRVTVHEDLRCAKWKQQAPTENKYWTKIEDYMGMFEICERMIDRKIIDEHMFKSLYEYRVYNILQNKELAKAKLIYEYYDWQHFYKLLTRLYGKSWNELYVFLEKLEIDYNEINSENELISKLTRKEKDVYNNLIKKVKLAQS